MPLHRISKNLLAYQLRRFINLTVVKCFIINDTTKWN